MKPGKLIAGTTESTNHAAAADPVAVEPLLAVKGLTVQHAARIGDRTILRSIDLSVARGETVGIVGESGSGKSMLAKAVMRLLPRDVYARGQVHFDGQDVLAASARGATALRGEQMTLLYQDPFTMLNPLLTAGGHVVEALRAGRSRDARPTRRSAATQAGERLAEVGIVDPDVFPSLPIPVVRRNAPARRPGYCPGKGSASADRGRALDRPRCHHSGRDPPIAQIRPVCPLHGARSHHSRPAGRFPRCATASTFSTRGHCWKLAQRITSSANRCTRTPRGCCCRRPAVDRKVAVLAAIRGVVPAPDDVADQCVFAPRCEYVTDVCIQGAPPLRKVDDRLSACVRIEEISTELAVRRAVSSATADPTAPAEPTPPLLVVDNLVKTFHGHRGRPTTALAGVTIHVGRNESVGVVGESGSGKTTLGRCVVGLETPSSGSIFLDEIAAHDYAGAGAANRRALRRTAQIVFQDPYSSLDPKQTVRSTLLETLRVNGVGRDAARNRVDELLGDVGLPVDYGSRLPAALSGGERQRVAIARALAVAPALIVCDEPVSALDVSVQAQILTLLQEIRGRTGVSYLFITHDLAVVRQIADRIYVLHNGQVVEHGPIEQVMDRPTDDYTKRLLASIPASTMSQDPPPLGTASPPAGEEKS